MELGSRPSAAEPRYRNTGSGQARKKRSPIGHHEPPGAMRRVVLEAPLTPGCTNPTRSADVPSGLREEPLAKRSRPLVRLAISPDHMKAMLDEMTIECKRRLNAESLHEDEAHRIDERICLVRIPPKNSYSRLLIEFRNSEYW